MSYSEEQIEQKRLLALQRKAQQKTEINKATPNCGKAGNTSKVFEYGEKKQTDFKAKFGNTSYKSNTSFNKRKDRFDPLETQNFYNKKLRITAKCFMITNDRFTMELTSYFLPVIECLKTVSSRSYGKVFVYKREIY